MVLAVLDSGWLTMGERTAEFEVKFAKWIGAKHAIAVANGTAALHLAHNILDLDPGDEVICPSLSFVAGANAILYCGLKPVFADVCSEDNLTISPQSILAKITSRTRVVQVMHYGGYTCEMKAVRAIADQYHLMIIEDCAHAPGASFENINVGSWGDVGCFSFFSNKNMTTGEGGMITTDNDDFAAELRLRRSHGMTAQTMDRYRGLAFTYDVVTQGFNYRMDELRAAIGLAQLAKLTSYNDRRKEISGLYRRSLSSIEKITMPFSQAHHKSAYHLFPILLENPEEREGLMTFLRKKQIQTSIHYPPIHQFKYYRGLGRHTAIDLPVTEDIAGRLLSLPLYPSMRNDDVALVCACVSKYFNQ